MPGLVVQVSERTTGDFGKDTSAVDGSFWIASVAPTPSE